MSAKIRRPNYTHLNVMIFKQTSETTVSLFFFPLIGVFLLMTSMPIARAETASDFTSDVQRGIRAGVQSSVVINIKTQDYKTSWDEFGTNILIDGASTPAEIQRNLTEDIVNGLQTELTYNQKDEQYLRLRHSSPEEILALEGDGGNDLLPKDSIDPNPSLDANPEVNPSALDIPASAVDTSDTPAAPDVGSTPDTEMIIPDNLVPPEGEWKPSEVKVFETILNTDSPPTDVPGEPPPDTPPPADAPAD